MAALTDFKKTFILATVTKTFATAEMLAAKIKICSFFHIEANIVLNEIFCVIVYIIWILIMTTLGDISVHRGCSIKKLVILVFQKDLTFWSGNCSTTKYLHEYYEKFSHPVKEVYPVQWLCSCKE